MPNWVYNGLTIEGNPESVNKLVKQMNSPFSRNAENWNVKTGKMEYQIFLYSNPVFSFRNIIAPTDLEAYEKQPVRSELDINDPNWWEDTERLRLTDKSWYSWNITNWGVKWDVAVSDDEEHPETYMEGPTENGENLVVYYNFNTAWGIPDTALSNLSSQYPDLLFTLSYEEETGWGGEHEYLRGEALGGSEYGWKCRDCDHTEDEAPWCEDCQYDMCPECGWGEPDESCELHKEKVDA